MVHVKDTICIIMSTSFILVTTVRILVLEPYLLIIYMNLYVCDS